MERKVELPAGADKDRVAFWRHHVTEWRGSGLSQNAYAHRTPGVTQSSLSAWARRFGAEIPVVQGIPGTKAGQTASVPAQSSDGPAATSDAARTQFEAASTSVPAGMAPVGPSARWLEHVRAWRTSGLTQAEYAAAAGIRLNSLRKWSSRLGLMAVDAGQESSPAQQATVIDISALLSTAAPTATHAGFRLCLRSGHCLEIPPHFPEQSLQAICNCLGVHS